MEIFFILAAAIFVVAAVIFRVKVGPDFNLSLGVVAALIALLPALGVFGITTSIAKDSDQTYNEYWNGFEVSASTNVQQCERDGWCVNEYNCDPYQVTRVESYTDSEGKSKTRTVTETKYHSCPYSTEETTYVVDTTLGAFTIARSLMTGEEFRWGMGIPGGRVTTPPQLWSDAKARVDSGKPGPVTKVNEYKNYILASDSSILKRYSSAIEDYKAKNLLPAPSAGVYDVYQASKAYFVGSLPEIDAPAYTKDVANLTAALGTELQGDLHVVFVNANEVGDPTDYGNSLISYWQSEELGRNAIGKNAIVVIIAVDSYQTPAPVATATPTPQPTDVAATTATGTTEGTVTPVNTIKDGTPVVAWAKAYTGMPLGNEMLIQQIESQMKGKVVDSYLLGHPDYVGGSIKHSDGALEAILFGNNAFERISMDDLDADDKGSGFHYLSDEWQPDAGVMTIIFVISSIVCAAVFALLAFMVYTYGRAVTIDPLGSFFNKLTHKKA